MADTRIKGLEFPFSLTSGVPDIVEGSDLIKSSIKIILSWPLYTREYEDDFGSRIHEALESQNDNTLIALIKRFVIGAISKWETRIELTKLVFTRPSNEKLVVDISYNIKDINIEDTFTYTFYTN